MIVTFVSQCEKKALARTRRVLDAFANRIGDNTWQTVITEDGLLAVKRLLKLTSSKNTAVACHRIKTRIRTELQWIVGNRNKFDNQGLVPVNRTQKDVFMDVMTMKAKKDEFYANTHLQPLPEHLFAIGHIAHQLFIKVVGNDENSNLAHVAFLGGCLHDLGKIDPLFQDWVKKGKQKDGEDDGQHIDTKFTFDKHPRHNEISLLLFNLFEKQCSGLNNAQKEALQHVIYWHHAKPYRKEDDFTGVFKAYDYLAKNLSQEQLKQIVEQVVKQLKRVNGIAKNYGNDNLAIEKYLNWQDEDFESLIDDFSYAFKNTTFPDFKIYNLTDSFDQLRRKITTNAQHNLLRACVISADRLVSSLSAFELNQLIEEERLGEVLLENQEIISNLVSHINDALDKFPNSERTQNQSEVAAQLADLPNIAVLAGAAGCGKTKIALEWAKNKNAQKIIWVCPRVQVCQGIFQELIENYLPDTNIEILTGEFKFTNSWDKSTPEDNYFSGDVVVTTIDQILGAITTHNNVNSLLPFVEAHVVFDEYHEYINMEIFNLLFAELIANKNMRQKYDKRVLLVSATPHYSYLKEILDIDPQYDVVEMPSFNNSQYQLEFVEPDGSDRLQNPFYQQYDQNTFVISNTAYTAQLGFLYQKEQENSVLLHSKYKRSDKKYWFNEVYESFKKDGNHKYAVLRSGPIVQASLNISCDYMLTEMSSPENILQRLGRLDRFGKNEDINKLTIVITEDLKRGKQVSASSKFLAKLHNLQSAKAWYLFLTENLDGRVFSLPEIYQLYKGFYSSSHQQAIKQDLEAAIKSSINLLNAKVTEPVKVVKVKTDEKKMKISKNSLRGDNRFVQLAKLDVNNYSSPVFLNEYAYQAPLSDKDEFDNLTESLTTIRDVGLINFIAQKHGNIDPTHPVKGIPEKKQTARCKVLETYARDADYPLYLSYIEDDLNKVGGTGIRQDHAIYYAVCDKQPIGAISIRLINELNNSKEEVKNV